MARKIIQKPSKTITADDDIHYLQAVTRKALHSLENVIERLSVAEADDYKSLKETHELLFGQKASLAGTLVILADLLLKLEKEQISLSTDNEPEKSSYNLSAVDIALVEAFVKKLKTVEEI